MVLSRDSFSFFHFSSVFVYVFAAFFLTTAILYLPLTALASIGTLDTHALIALTNKDRMESGLHALAEDRVLNIAAQRKANDMAMSGYFSHIAPNGATPWSWLISLHYYYTRAAENLAKDFTTSTEVERAWMQSPSHRANILEKSYTRVGVGIAYGMYQGAPTTFVVQFFATPYVAKRNVNLVTSAMSPMIVLKI